MSKDKPILHSLLGVQLLDEKGATGLPLSQLMECLLAQPWRNEKPSGRPSWPDEKQVFAP